MNFEIYSRNILIVLGTFCGLAVLIAFVRTWSWYSKSGKNVIDLHVINNIIFYFDFHISLSALFIGRHWANFCFIYSVLLVRLFLSSWLLYRFGGWFSLKYVLLDFNRWSNIFVFYILFRNSTIVHWNLMHKDLKKHLKFY